MTQTPEDTRPRVVAPKREAAMDLCTSRYANPAVPTCGYAAVGVTLGFPKFIRYKLAAYRPRLGPSREIFGITDRELFTRLFREQLDRLGGDVMDMLTATYREAGDGYRGLVLLCFEDLRKLGEWCHRQIVAQWIEEKYGISVPEMAEPAGSEPRTRSRSAGRGSRRTVREGIAWFDQAQLPF